MYRFVMTYLFLAILSFVGKAQDLTQGSFKPLVGVYAATVQFDFSSATVGNQSFDDYLSVKALLNGKSNNDVVEKAGADLGKYVKRSIKKELKKLSK